MAEQKQQLKAVSKAAFNSFKQQQRLIKDVLAGKQTHCHVCGEIVNVDMTAEKTIHINCANTCIDILLET